MSFETIAIFKHHRLRPFSAGLCMLLLGGCSLFGIRTVEETSYTVVARDGDIELRNYAAYVSVETTVGGDFEEAGNRAFRRLFDYISGENRARQKIEMTAPVTASAAAGASETIDMTAPVLASESGRGWSYAFVLPAGYTIDDAPLPLRDDVRLALNEPRQVAVLTFSGSWKHSAFEENLARLRGWIEERQLATASSPRFAGYDPPWTLPFLRRNEILIDIES